MYCDNNWCCMNFNDFHFGSQFAPKVNEEHVRTQAHSKPLPLVGAKILTIKQRRQYEQKSMAKIIFTF